MTATARAADVARSSRREARRELAAIVSPRVLIFLAVFVVLIILFHVLSNGLFLTPRNLSLLLRQGAILGVVATGVGVLMIMSEIDLSIGSSVFLCGVVAASLATGGTPLGVALLATLVTGMVLGALQGVAVVVLGIPSFIATLAGLLAFRGLGLLLTNAATVGPVPDNFSAVSEGFIPRVPSIVAIIVIAVVAAAGVLLGNRNRMRRLRADSESDAKTSRGAAPLIRASAQLAAVIIPLGVLAWIVGGFLGTPTALIWVAVIAVALTVLTTRTIYGRNAYLLGANREAAYYSGIRVRRNVFFGFVIMGALYGVAAILLTARLGSSTPGAGQDLELQAIAAAVIGGISLRGGIGGIGGAVIGALLLTLINNGMSLLNVSSFSQAVIMGLILVLALGLDSYVLRRAAR